MTNTSDPLRRLLRLIAIEAKWQMMLATWGAYHHEADSVWGREQFWRGLRKPWSF